MKRPISASVPALGTLVLGVLVAGCESAPSTMIRSGNPDVDAVFAEYDRDDSPGCSLGVIRDGEFVYRRGYGMANLEYGIPIASDSVFRVGSVSKQFTAMTVLLLEEEGKLSLDDDMRSYLPEMPDFGETLSIADLVHHTSGLRDYLVLMSLAGVRDEDYYDAQDLYATLTRQRNLNFDPGEEFLYSNSGYFLLGQIVERVTGQTLAQAAAERIFVPLGMTDTRFQDDTTRLVPRRATGYAPLPGGGFHISETTLPIVGDGAVFTTVEDLLQWDRNTYDNRLGKGGPDLIRRWTERAVLNDGEHLDYASGITVGEYRGLTLQSHGGAFVGFRAEAMRFPEQRFGVVVLCNVGTANPSRLARRVADVYLGDLMEPVITEAGDGDDEDEPPAAAGDEFPLPVSQLRDYEGVYVSREIDATYVVEIRDGRLHFGIPRRIEGFLAPEQEDRFHSVESQADASGMSLQFRFARAGDGRVTGFLLDAGRVVNLWFSRSE